MDRIAQLASTLEMNQWEKCKDQPMMSKGDQMNIYIYIYILIKFSKP